MVIFNIGIQILTRSNLFDWNFHFFIDFCFNFLNLFLAQRWFHSFWIIKTSKWLHIITFKLHFKNTFFINSCLLFSCSFFCFFFGFYCSFSSFKIWRISFFCIKNSRMLLWVIWVTNYWEPLWAIVHMKFDHLRIWILQIGPHILMIKYDVNRRERQLSKLINMFFTRHRILELIR